MSRVIAWFVHNPVAANLMMLVMILGGLLALPLIKQEEFPAIETDVAQISVEYPGASPAEIEESICMRIEEEIDGTPDIDRINTTAVEGACVIMVEMVAGSNIDAAINEFESRINGIDTFPIDAEKPMVSKLVVKRRVMQVAISMTEEDVAWPVIMRICKRLGWKMMDPSSGRMFGAG